MFTPVDAMVLVRQFKNKAPDYSLLHHLFIKKKDATKVDTHRRERIRSVCAARIIFSPRSRVSDKKDDARTCALYYECAGVVIANAVIVHSRAGDYFAEKHESCNYSALHKLT